MHLLVIWGETAENKVTGFLGNNRTIINFNCLGFEVNNLLADLQVRRRVSWTHHDNTYIYHDTICWCVILQSSCNLRVRWWTAGWDVLMYEKFYLQ